MVDEALERLLAGDPRFVAGRRAYLDQTPAHHRELAAGQHTFAAILGCADSRVPPEITFRIPARGGYYSVDHGYENYWSEGMRRFTHQFEAGGSVVSQ